MRFITLGTAHGDPTPIRFNTSSLLDCAQGRVLIDAGTPVLALLIRKGIDPNSVHEVLITHMHEDHFGGLPDLMKFAAKRRVRGSRPLRIHLPEEAAIAPIRSFLEVAHRPIPEEFVTFDVLTAGSRAVADGIQVTAYPTRHFANEKLEFPSFALALEAENRRVVVTGDLCRDFSDFPLEALQSETDLCCCELTHYDLRKALPALAQVEVGKMIFHHVGNEWHLPGSAELFRRSCRELPYPCMIAQDGEEFVL